MALTLIHSSTAVRQDKQVYQLVGSGSCKKFEPVKVTNNPGDIDEFGNCLPFIITYANGKSHQIGYNWYFYA